ncbi:MAG TPA: FHA domain-containing protein [Fimbriimonas sp.]|nr:FHA domain-containing protein [Fimbriimonas sp.]
MGSLLAKFLAGGATGLLAWAIMEPLAPRMGSEAWGTWEIELIALFGAAIGFVIGGYDGYTRGGKVHTLRGFGLGLLFGVVAGLFGYSIGGRIEDTIFGASIFVSGNEFAKIPPRTLVFAIWGLALGAGIGASSLTGKRTIQGALGGLLGAGIGGLVFDPIGYVLAATILSLKGQHSGEVGIASRAVAFTITGASIALFIGLVERWTRSAWLRIDYGRNEYKEWSIDSAQTFIGRNESASVPLRGDPNVAPVHAVIQKQGSQYVLSDGGSPIGTYVNGQRIQQAILTPGAIIQIGSFALRFLVKGTPAPVYAPDMQRGQAYAHALPQQPMPQLTPGYPAAPVPQPLPGNQTVAYQQTPAATPAPTAVAPGFALVALDGSVAGQRFPIGGPIEVGREASGIRLTGDVNASRRHASVSPGFSGVSVTDLGSTNGTFVNGQRVQNAEARTGDVIKIGGTSFRVESA